MFTDAEGRYRCETQWPAIRPPHIRLLITADGYQVLETPQAGDNRSRDIDLDIVLWFNVSE